MYKTLWDPSWHIPDLCVDILKGNLKKKETDLNVEKWMSFSGRKGIQVCVQGSERSKSPPWLQGVGDKQHLEKADTIVCPENIFRFAFEKFIWQDGGGRTVKDETDGREAIRKCQDKPSEKWRGPELLRDEMLEPGLLK